MSDEISKRRAELRRLHDDAVRAKTEATKAHRDWRDVYPRDMGQPSPIARTRHARWQDAQRRYDALRATIEAEQQALRDLIAATPERPNTRAVAP